MKLRHNDIEIPPEEPFKNCKLQRKEQAEVLTSIVGSYADGFVLAINNEWGTGKTTFVKMWQQLMKNNGFQSLYFNAWENDFDSNPLVALMSELKSLTKKNDATFKSLIKKGAVITKNVLPSLAKAIANKYIDIEALKEVVEDTTEAVGEILKDEIDLYAAKKKGLVEFRKELEKFIITHNNGKPLVFIIDELDRCRPNYAVEVLEQVKHFFNVPGIVFVLSLDKTQLSYAIRGVYGSDHIDTNEYMRRFIDLEYVIPRPNHTEYCKYLYSYFQFDDFFDSQERRKFNDLARDGNSFVNIADLLLKNQTLRQIEKIFAYTRVVLRTFPIENYVLPQLLLFLIYMKSSEPEFYNEMQNKSISLEALLVKFSDITPKADKENRRSLTYLEAEIVYRYANYLNYGGGEKLVQINGEKNVLSYQSKMDDTENFTQSISIIGYLRQDYRLSDVKIDYLLKKISLTENLIS